MSTETALPVGGVYTIQNMHDNSYLTVVGKRPWWKKRECRPDDPRVACPSARIEQRSELGQPNLIYQLWQVYQIDHGRYIFASKASGLCLSIKGNRKTPGSDLVLRPLQEGNAAQTWTLKYLGLNIGSIQNVSSLLFLKSVSRGCNQTPIIQQWPVAEGEEATLRLWAIKAQGPLNEFIMEEENKPVSADGDIGDITRLCNWKLPNPTVTGPVLVSRVVIPYLLINDPKHTRRQQALDCPFYVLRRYGYWRLAFFHEHSGLTETKESRSYPVGLVSNNQEELERITGISVGANAGFCFNGLSKFIRIKMATNLKVDFCYGVGESETAGVEHRYFVGSAGSKMADAHWHREDRYELVRSDETVVLEWITCDRRTTVNDVFVTPTLGIESSQPSISQCE